MGLMRTSGVCELDDRSDRQMRFGNKPARWSAEEIERRMIVLMKVLANKMAINLNLFVC